jgi:two-component system sensor histidine kinase PilS (NtrC family)
MTAPHTLAKGQSGAAESGPTISTSAALLKWVYVGRLSVATAIFVAFSFYFTEHPPAQFFIITLTLVLSLVFTGASFFHTHVRGAVPTPTFLYMQTLFDVGLVTAVVHVTGGANSDFASLYILVIAVSAVTMPIASGLLVTILAAVLYVADVLFGPYLADGGGPVQLSVSLWFQVGVFVLVALAVSYLASRVRVVGAARTVLEQEVKRLRLEAPDILRQLVTGVVTVDGDGSLAFANPAAEQLLGFQGEQYLGLPFLDFLEDVSEELAEGIVMAQRDRRRRMRLTGSVAFGGRTFPIGVTTTLHETEGEEPGSVTAIFADISDQVRLQELNRRTERLEAVAELSASLAHEIKNPLASIRSSVEQLGQSAYADEDDRFLAQLIVRESDRLSRLLTDFLDFSRLQVGEPQPVDMAAVAEAAVAVVREHPDCPPDADVTIKGHCAPIVGDEDLLHRVVVNLLLNAMQASNGKASVTLVLRDVEASDVPGGALREPYILLEVSDTGPGIPPELRDKLFDPFVTGRDGGTGLGLSIVQRAVAAHRGLMFVDTETGKGTTFSIYLPRTRRTEVAA